MNNTDCLLVNSVIGSTVFQTNSEHPFIIEFQDDHYYAVYKGIRHKLTQDDHIRLMKTMNDSKRLQKVVPDKYIKDHL